MNRKEFLSFPYIDTPTERISFTENKKNENK